MEEDETCPMELWLHAKMTISQRLAQNAMEPQKKKLLEEMILERYLKYQKVFEQVVSERLPKHGRWDHAIDLDPNFVPRDCKIYPKNPREQKIQDEFLEENLRKGYIRPSKSPIASPFFFVAKKEEEALQLCQDYRILNKATIKNAYPLPLISELLDKLQGQNGLRNSISGGDTTISG